MKMQRTLSPNNKKNAYYTGCTSTSLQTPNKRSPRESRVIQSTKKTIQTNRTVRNLYKKKMSFLLAGVTQNISIKSQPPKFEVPIKTDNDIYIQDRLEQMKQDRVYHLLFKNRIKRKFFANKSLKDQGKTIEVNPENVYNTTQNQTIQGRPKYSYLDLTSTFYSRSRKRVFDETYYEDVNKATTQYFSQRHPLQTKQGANFLLYTSDRLHKKKFRDSKKCKTMGSVNLSMNKQEILKMSREGSKQRRLISQYLDQALHEH